MKNKEKQINEIKNNIEKMEKDLAEQKKLVAKLEKGDYEVGDEVSYKGFDWYVINIIETTFDRKFAVLMLKNKLNDSQLKALGFSYDSDNDIVYNSDKTNNDWQDSNVRKCVIAFANKYLDIDVLEKTTINYDENKVSEDYIRIPTLREVEVLPKEIRKVNASSGYWTMTASYGATDQDSYARVFYVNGTFGYLGFDWVNDANGVRPVITLLTEELN